MGRAELFPRDWRLALQMVLIALITPVVVVVVLVWLLIVSSELWQGLIGFGLLAGTVAVVQDWRARPPVQPATSAQAPELMALVHRLCVVADVTAPDLVIENARQPNSWLIHVPRRTARLHVTTGLLELLDRDELAAVVAHELSHLANGDATLMTVVGMPGMIAAHGSRRGGGTWILKLIGAISAVGTNALSRRRELAADRGASALTGRPSALASALIKASEGVARAPQSDLRQVAMADSFRLVPTSPRRDGWVNDLPILWRLAETHPPLQRRVAALERLEAHLQHARATP